MTRKNKLKECMHHNSISLHISLNNVHFFYHNHMYVFLCVGEGFTVPEELLFQLTNKDPKDVLITALSQKYGEYERFVLFFLR